MSISIREFSVAMETIGAKQLKDTVYSKPSPCFEVNGIEFGVEFINLDTDLYYIAQRGKEIPTDITNQLLLICGEEYCTDDDNLDYTAIYSIRALFTVITMINGTYSLELIDELINKTYEKLLDSAIFKTNIPFKYSPSPKMKELYKILSEYNMTVNPFSNNKHSFKKTTEYLKKLDMNISEEDDSLWLTLANGYTKAIFNYGSRGWGYGSNMVVQKNHQNMQVQISYAYNNNEEYDSIDDEYVSLLIRSNFSIIISLEISLKSGLAQTRSPESGWSSWAPVTNEELNLMISYLKMSTQVIKRRLIKKMLNTSVA